MCTKTKEITVTEFLRPEGSHEPAVYSVQDSLDVVIAIIEAKCLQPCCDIYLDGTCRVYIYDPIDEIAVATSPKRSHSVAHSLLDDLLSNFDLQGLT